MRTMRRRAGEKREKKWQATIQVFLLWTPGTVEAEAETI
jgi:hypothetical protein